MASSSSQKKYKLIKLFKCNQGALRAVRYNVDGEYLFTCGADRTFKLWNIAKSLQIANFQGHSGPVLDARGSCDNAQILSGSTDKNVSLWDVSTGRMVRRFRGHVSSITSVIFNEESSVGISGAQDNSVKLWDLRSRGEKPIQTLDEMKDSVTSMAITDVKILVGSSDGFTYAYDIRQGTMSVDAFGEPVSCVAVSRDKASHLVGVADGTVKLVDSDQGTLLASYKGHCPEKFRDYRIEVAFDYADESVIAGSPIGRIFIWDLVSEKIIEELDPGTTHAVVSLAAHPTKFQIVAASGMEVTVFGVEEDDET